MKRGRSPIRYVAHFRERDFVEDLLGLPERDAEGSKRHVIERFAADIGQRLPNYEQDQAGAIVSLALEQPTKHCALANLLAWVGVKSDYGQDFAKRVLSECAEALANGFPLPRGSKKRGRPDGAAILHVKQALRFLVCCAANRVLAPAKCFDIVHALLDSASAHLSGGDGGGDTAMETAGGAMYADFVVYCVLAALPWGLEKLAAGEHAAATQGVLDKVGAYMRARSGLAKNGSLSLCREAAAIAKPSDTSGLVGHVTWIWGLYERDGLASSDGVASFDWTKLREGILHFDEAGAGEAPQANEEAAAMKTEDGAAAGNGADAGAAADAKDGAVVEKEKKEGDPFKYLKSVGEGIEVALPNGDMDADGLEEIVSCVISHHAMLPEQHTRLGASSLNQLVVEECCLDLMTTMSRSPNDLVPALAALPVAFKYQAVLVESVFAHMLQLPSQQFSPLYYSGVISDLCVKMERFPQYMAAYAKYAIAKVELLDLEACGRLARWQAYHLSAFQFSWPWEKWGWTDFPALPAHDRRRIYLEDLFVALQRLSYHEHITKKVPEALHVCVTSAAAGSGQPNKEVGPPEEDSRKKIDMMSQLIFKKKSADDFLEYLGEVTDPTMLRGVVMAILCIGGKSFTHMRTLLGRYRKVIDAFLAREEQAGGGILDLLHGVWSGTPDKFMMAFTCMLECGIINDVDALDWTVKEGGEGGGDLVRGRARIHWDVVESSLTASVLMCAESGTSDEAKAFYAAGCKRFWERMISKLQEAEGGASAASWFAYSLERCHGLLRRHAKGFNAIAVADLVAESATSDSVKGSLLAALACYEIQ